MKLLFITLICISLIFINSKSLEKRSKTRHMSKHKVHNHHKSLALNTTVAAGNGSAAKNGTSAAPAEKRIETIKFGPAAAHVSPELNSLGSKVKDNVILTDFPFKIQRCDSIVYFAAAYINDFNDYRVRKPGYVSITAHYTNLYADKDGQKLIQHVLHSLMPSLPSLVSGAEGCIKIGGDKGQKNMLICTPTTVNANNLLQVYKDFTRCRLGDNLTEIPKKHLEKLMKLCGVDKSKLLSTDGSQANVQAGSVGNHALLSKLSSEDKAKMKQLLRNQKAKKKTPEFEFPSAENNKWESQRLSYFQPSKLMVPGGQVQTQVAPGMAPGLNPINNPAVVG